MIDYQVYDYAYRGSIYFKTLEEAREYVANQIQEWDASSSDFAIFKRERIEYA